jgi:hypothetical protein
MIKKGLCSTCSNDKDCAFPRKFPVWQCEEFNGYKTKNARINDAKKINKTLRKRAKSAMQSRKKEKKIAS